MLEEHVPSKDPEGQVGFSHGFGRGDLRSWWRGGVSNKGEEGEAFLQGEGEVC